MLSSLQAAPGGAECAGFGSWKQMGETRCVFFFLPEALNHGAAYS